ncbi:MAG: YitT family protein [Clostridia bacterium]|nr:YitT family protein [Clostridia bacterium]
MDNEEKNSPAEGEITEKTENKAAKPMLDNLMTKRQLKVRAVMQWVLISLGSFMMAVSVYFFQTPNNITLGGIAGVAFLLGKFALSQGIWMLIINGSLLVLGLIILGKQCTLRTVYSSALYTGLIYLFEFIGKYVNLQLPVTGSNMFLSLTYACLLFGVGGALIFNCGASSGGTDIIALIFKKFTRLNVGVALFIVDFSVIWLTLCDPEVTVEILMYSFMGLFAKSFLLDSVIEGLGRTKYITIITSMPDEIGQYILDVVRHSYTVYEAKGGYTGEEKKIILTICKRNEAWKLKAKIKQIDPSAFVIISNANEIVGKGFGGTAL